MTDSLRSLKRMIKLLVTEAMDDKQATGSKWILQASDGLEDLFHGIQGWTNTAEQADTFNSREEAEKALAKVKQSDPYPDADYSVFELS